MLIYTLTGVGYTPFSVVASSQPQDVVHLFQHLWWPSAIPT